jgi:hypothetical protein
LQSFLGNLRKIFGTQVSGVLSTGAASYIPEHHAKRHSADFNTGKKVPQPANVYRFGPCYFGLIRVVWTICFSSKPRYCKHLKVIPALPYGNGTLRASYLAMNAIWDSLGPAQNIDLRNILSVRRGDLPAAEQVIPIEENQICAT